MAGGQTFGNRIKPLKARGLGAVVLMLAAAVGLPLALVTSWTRHGFMEGTLIALLLIVTFNVGLVVGFVLRAAAIRSSPPDA